MTNKAEQTAPSTHDSVGGSHLLERARTLVRRIDAREGLGIYWLIASLAAAVVLTVLRSPSYFTRAQFWAEDGKVFFAQAYNDGWLHSLTLPVSGYLCTLPRLAAGAAVLAPFVRAPLVMALVGLLFQAIPVPILLSPRCRNWAPLSFRLLFAAVYIGIPNARDVHVVCTNTLWHLGLAVTLLAFAAAPRSLAGRSFDAAMFLLASVSGPFAILLIPFFLIFWWIRRQQWTLVMLAMVAAGSLLQIVILRNYASERHIRVVGATVARFIRILGGDIFLGALRGSTAYGYRESLFRCLISLLIGVALITYCWLRASAEVRLFFLFSISVLAASLRSPIISPNSPLLPWEALLEVASLRYWYFPGIIFLWSVLWCAWEARSRLFRVAGVLLALLLVQGIVRDWRVPPLEDLHFSEYAAQFEAAPRGASVTIPINPPGWSMDLIKR